MIRYQLFFIVAAFLLAAAGCGDRSPSAGDSAHMHADSQPEPSGPTNRVEIPPVVQNNLGITFATVERRHVARTLRVPGRFELLPTARREYRMMMPGHVELLVDQYEQVDAGQPLYQFRSSAWTALQGERVAAEQGVLLAAAELRVAEATVSESRRRLEMIQMRMAALSEVEIRRADLELQAAEMEASLARLEAERELAAARVHAANWAHEQVLLRIAAAINVSPESLGGSPTQPPDDPLLITIRASEAGVVESIAVTSGAYVDDAMPVLATVIADRVRFRGSIMQGDAVRLGVGPEAQIVPPQSPGHRTGEPVPATVSIGLEASPAQRTIDLIAQPAPHEHREWMRPGVSAFLEVVLDGSSSGGDRPELAIPRSALMKDGLTHVFFRRDPRDPNAAIRVEADLGSDDGRWVVIRSGLRLGDEVVVEGAYELMLATAQSGSTMQGGHFHPDGTWHADH